MRLSAVSRVEIYRMSNYLLRASGAPCDVCAGLSDYPDRPGKCPRTLTKGGGPATDGSARCHQAMNQSPTQVRPAAYQTTYFFMNSGMASGSPLTDITKRRLRFSARLSSLAKKSPRVDISVLTSFMNASIKIAVTSKF